MSAVPLRFRDKRAWWVSNTGLTQTRKHPGLTAFKEVLGLFIKLSEKFGITPADRRRLDLAIDSNPHDDKDREFLGL